MQRVVVGIDGPDSARRALEWAFEEAGLRHARLCIAHVCDAPFEPTWGTLGVDVVECEAVARRLVDNALETRLAGEISVPIETLVVRGAPAPVLDEQSKDADLVVVGSRGRGGFAGLRLGSVSQQVAQHSVCRVVIVPSPR